MTPTKITLKNFKGIRAGLGCDVLSLDLAQYGDGLIAIVAPNGCGKSTLLDNLHPYRLMPSRAGGYSPGAFSYYDETHAPEAVKELEWSHRGIAYRSTIVIRQSPKTRKQECFLHVFVGGAWVAYTAPEVSLSSDGKTDTYDRCIEHILGSPEMFFTAAFAAQGRRALSDYGGADIKALFSELLGLDHLRELGAKAAQVAKALRFRLEVVQGRLRYLEEKRAALEQAKAAEQLAQAESEAADAALVQAREALEAATADEMQAREAEAAIALTLQRRRELEAQIAKGDATLQATVDNLNQSLHGIRLDLLKAKERLNQRDAALNQAAGTARRRLSALRQALAEEGRIRDAVHEAERLEQAEAALSTAVAEATRQHEAKVAIAGDMKALAAELTACTNEGKASSAALEDLRRRAELLQVVPCAGMEALESTCPLLGNAREAAARVDTAAAELANLRARFEQLKAAHDAAKMTFIAAGDTVSTMTAVARELDDVRLRLQAARQIAGRGDAVAAARAELPAVEQELRGIEAAQQAVANELDEAECTYREKGAFVNQEIARLRQKIEDARAEIQRAIDAMPAAAGTEKSEAAARRRGAAAALERKALDEHTNFKTRAAVARQNVQRAEEDVAEREADVATEAALSDEIAQWVLLSRAFSNDGIVALSIDDAGPTLSSLANQLLTSCYGPRFSISIATQEATAKGGLRETLDILVFDADRGDKKSVRDMSGGERVWINECLTRALALYRGSLSAGTQYETLFADETDGALDPERKRAYMKMKRAELELSGAAREFFITHTEELWRDADEVIHLAYFREDN